MKKFKISQREKVYLIAGGIALFIGVVLFPAYKATGIYRAEQLEQLEGEIALLESLKGLIADAGAIQTENERLNHALKGADALLFPPIENRIMTQTKMIKLLNEMGPDLDLEVSAGRSGIGDASSQMNLLLKGRGRYPEILKFLERVETHRPLMLVNSMMLTAPRPKRARSRASKKNPEKTKDPSMGFRLTIQIHTRAGKEGGA
ncbi:MAG: hypothetical protein V5783_09935 [Pontiella sp.]